MATKRPCAFTRHIEKLVAEHRYSQLTDRELLRCFTQHRDEVAFQTLVKKHGALVWNVCQRLTGNVHDADDVFQSTFLVLLKRAPALCWRDSIAGWLHEVACRLAAKTTSGAIRRHTKESQTAARVVSDPVGALTIREAQSILHEELKRLPETLRAPLVLCYLESTAQEEAARQLGWSYRTLKRRLERGRALLELRLTRRGLALSGILSAGLLAPTPAPASLVRAAVQAGVSLGNGKTAATVSASVAALVQGMVRMSLATRVAVIATVMVVAGLVATGLVVTGSLSQPTKRPPEQAEPGPRQALVGKPAKADKPLVDRYGDPLPPGALARLGTVRFRHDSPLYARAISPDGRILAGGGNYGIQLWDAETGRTLHRIPDEFGFVGALAFTPDSKTLVSYSGMTGMLRFSEVATGTGCVEFLVDSKTLLVGGDIDTFKNALAFVDAVSGNTVRQFDGHYGVVESLAYSSDGRYVATASREGGELRVWDASTGRIVFEDGYHGRSANALAFVPQRSVLAVADRNEILLWDVEARKLLRKLPANQQRPLRYASRLTEASLRLATRTGPYGCAI